MSRRGFTVAPPSPVPTGKGLRSSAINDKILSDFLTASLHIPDLKLPVSFQSRHLLISPVDYRSIVSGDCDAIESVTRSVSEFGFFAFSGHGVTLTDVEAIRGEEVRERKRREAEEEGFDFIWAGDEDEESELHPDIHSDPDLRSRLERKEAQLVAVGKLLGKIFYTGASSFGSVKAKVTSSLKVLKFNVDYQLSRGETFFNDEDNDTDRYCENESALGLCLPSSKCKVLVQVGAESFVFQAAADTIVAIPGLQLEVGGGVKNLPRKLRFVQPGDDQNNASHQLIISIGLKLDRVIAVTDQNLSFYIEGNPQNYNWSRASKTSDSHNAVQHQSSRDVHAVPSAICEPDSESSSEETQNVNEDAHSSRHGLYMSSHVNNAAAQLQGISLPSQFGNRQITSTGMYHTQSQSHPKKARWSGNSNRYHTQSQSHAEKMKPFDIFESSLAASSFPKNKEVLVKKHVTDDTGGILRPGMVLLKNYIPLHDQVKIVRLCQRLGLGEGGFYQPVFESGAKLRLQMMCLGLDWDPQTKKYGEMRRLDGARPPAIPNSFISLTEKAIDAAHDLIKVNLSEGNAVDILPHMHPNICIVNFYDTSGRLGLHQDKDESRESLHKGLPVVSISLGDSAMFLYGDQRDIDKADKVLLESGDVLIFGGCSRHVFHGVDSIIPDSAPAAFQQATKLRPGRLNLTFREF